jgi:uncharacterized membrane protein YdjX (TVP38/TMEM64 family)
VRRSTRRQVAGLLAAGAAVAAAAAVAPPGRVAATLDEARADPAVLGTLLVAAYLLRAVAAWPVTVLSAVVGYVFGLAGLPVAAAGTVVTALPPYLLARRVGTAGPLGWVAGLAEEYVDATGGFRGVLAARLAPVHTDAVSCGAGLADVRLRAFVAGTFLGELPWAVAAVLAGASTARVVAGADTPLSLVVGAGALALLLLAGPAYERFAGVAGADAAD